MSPKHSLLHLQETFTVHYKSVADFLQTVQEAGVRIVHVEALQRRLRATDVWGGLLTARLGDEIHVAWVVAYYAIAPSARQRDHALSEQTRISTQVQALATQAGLTCRPGFYAVPEVFAFYAAALPDEEPTTAPEGGQA